MPNIDNQTGRIFDIQRFSIHDGPGIRTIVFLKGCFLRCKWCCNPESQNHDIESMLTANGETTLTGRDVTVKEVIETVLKDSTYYRRSGGGMTLSGGEFLFQPQFSLALLKSAKEHGLSTAVETTSYSEYGIIKEMLPFIDNYLMDIKHINSNKHKQFTGRENELILENAKKIAKDFDGNFCVRVPVIPTFNDTEEEIADIAAFAKELKTVSGIHLLPYHRLGQDKYGYLNRRYALEDLIPPTNEKMQLLLNVAKNVSGINCQIGG